MRSLTTDKDYTFWGRGVSQGHSDACRRIEGVLDARQYTVPVPEAVEKVRNGENPELTTRQKHTRVAYVVAKEGADKARIEKEIKEMPNYFADYDTTVLVVYSRWSDPWNESDIIECWNFIIFISSDLSISNTSGGI